MKKYNHYFVIIYTLTSQLVVASHLLPEIEYDFLEQQLVTLKPTNHQQIFTYNQVCKRWQRYIQLLLPRYIEVYAKQHNTTAYIIAQELKNLGRDYITINHTILDAVVFPPQNQQEILTKLLDHPLYVVHYTNTLIEQYYYSALQQVIMQGKSDLLQLWIDKNILARLSAPQYQIVFACCYQRHLSPSDLSAQHLKCFEMLLQNRTQCKAPIAISQHLSINLPVRYAQPNYFKLLKLLLHNKADPNAKDSLGETALHKVCKHAHNVDFNTTGAVKILLDHQADFSLKNRFGQTPTDLMKDMSSSCYLFK